MTKPVVVAARIGPPLHAPPPAYAAAVMSAPAGCGRLPEATGAVKNRQGKERDAARKRRRTGKKKKEPLSGYMLFCKTKRAKVVADLPDATFGEVSKEFGRRWKALSDFEKAEFYKVSVTRVVACVRPATSTLP